MHLHLTKYTCIGPITHALNQLHLHWTWCTCTGPGAPTLAPVTCTGPSAAALEQVHLHWTTCTGPVLSVSARNQVHLYRTKCTCTGPSTDRYQCTLLHAVHMYYIDVTFPPC